MARRKRDPIEPDIARHIGGLLRGLRKTAGYRAVADAAGSKDCPAAQQTIYAYERGGLVPSLPQFLELVEFYAQDGSPEVRYQAIAAIGAATSSRAYHIPQAMELIEELQPPVDKGRRRKG